MQCQVDRVLLAFIDPQRRDPLRDFERDQRANDAKRNSERSAYQLIDQLLRVTVDNPQWRR